MQVSDVAQRAAERGKSLAVEGGGNTCLVSTLESRCWGLLWTGVCVRTVYAGEKDSWFDEYCQEGLEDPMMERGFGWICPRIGGGVRREWLTRL